MSNNTQQRINEIVKQRGLPQIKQFSSVIVDGREGVIIGGNCLGNLNVLFDGDKVAKNCHPYWRMKILNDDGSIYYDSEEQYSV